MFTKKSHNYTRNIDTISKIGTYFIIKICTKSYSFINYTIYNLHTST